MVVAAFPIAKLAILAVRQVSKPVANIIKNEAKRSPFFRSYVCMPPAQFYHWVEVNIKMRMLNLGKPTEVPKLNESMAIDLGAELLGEGIIFGVAAAALVAEYVRSSKKEREKEEEREARTQDMERKLTDLELRLAEQQTRLQELNRFTYGIHTSVADWWRKKPEGGASSRPSNPPSSSAVEPPSSGSSGHIISRALDEVDSAVRGKQG